MEVISKDLAIEELKVYLESHLDEDVYPDGVDVEKDYKKTLKAMIDGRLVIKDGNRSAIDSIACLPDVISVGATDNPDKGTKGIAYDSKAKPYIARYSNGNAQTSFYLNARMYVLQTSGAQKFTVGTSNATASLAGLWTLNRKSSVADTKATLDSLATTASNEWLTGKYLQLP